MSVYPFIAAEKAAERTVAKACALMEVSRSAFYVSHRHEPGPRARADAELTGTIVEIHRASRGTYGSPRITARFRTGAELRARTEQAGISVEAVRGAVYYPPVGTAARVLAPVDGWAGRRTTVGAAFIALAGTKALG